jgi:glucokinase
MFLAIEIGGTKLQLATGDAAGRLVRRWRHTVDRAAGAAGIRAQIAATLPDALAAGDVTAVGVGFGGPVDWRTGRGARSHQIEGWSDFDLAGWLGGLTKLPVFVDNDANVAALGEALNGAGQGADPVFYVTLGSGVGGGLVAGGRIYHGAPPGEAEIGHVRLDKSGTTIERRCAGWAVDARIREAVALHPSSPLALFTGTATRGEARFLGPALAEGDPLAQAILSELADHLAFGLSHVTQLLHPERIVLGGGLALLGEPLRAAVAEALRHYVMEAFGAGPAIVLAALREDAVPVGALRLAAARSGLPPG